MYVYSNENLKNKVTINFGTYIINKIGFPGKQYTYIYTLYDYEMVHCGTDILDVDESVCELMMNMDE